MSHRIFLKLTNDYSEKEWHSAINMSANSCSLYLDISLFAQCPGLWRIRGCIYEYVVFALVSWLPRVSCWRGQRWGSSAVAQREPCKNRCASPIWVPVPTQVLPAWSVRLPAPPRRALQSGPYFPSRLQAP